MENHYVQIFLDFLKNHTALSHFLIFLIAFSESLPLIGTIVPGSITMTLVGVLIGAGTFPAISSFVIASIGAFAGDFLGYGFGFYYNEKLRTIWPFKKYPHWLTAGEAFIQKHGGKSIILGRFIGPARSTVPMVAGLLKLNCKRFVIAAVPSAAFWAVMYMTPGIILGALSQEIPKGETTRFLIYGAIVLLTLWFIYWVIQHFFIQLTRGVNYLTDRLWSYLSEKHAGQFCIRYITNQQKRSDHHQLTLLLTGLLSGILFLFLFINVRLHTFIIKMNYPIFHVLQTIRTPLWNHIFSTITVMGMPKTVMFITLFVTAGLLIKKQWRSATHFFAAFFMTTCAVEVFKHLSHSVRPQGFVFVASSYSFPSGHTTLSFVIYSFIAFFAASLIKEGYRWIAYTISSIFIAIIGFSRLYLGAHWFTDIIGSMLLGLSILLLCIVHYRRMPKSTSALSISNKSAILILIASLLISYSVSLNRYLEMTINGTTPVWSKQYISTYNWWKTPLHYAPLYRNNRLGHPFQPFNVQFSGSLKQLENTLSKQGWQVIPLNPKMKLKLALQRFAHHQAQYHIAIFPLLYHDKPPVLFLIKLIPNQKSIIELRFWESGIHLQPGNKPLWLGALDTLIPPKKLLSLKERAMISLKNGGGLGVLLKDTSTLHQRLLYTSHQDSPEKINELNWDGKILLIRE